jgi:membrane-associated PAP2 superfamily phosphatase
MPVRSPTSLKAFGALRTLDIVLIVSGLLIIWIGNYSNLDLALADAMFDRASGTFPWRHAWLAEGFNHGILKTVMQVMGVSALAVAVWDWARPRPSWTAARRTGVRVLALSAILVPIIISVLKHFSDSHCPWDLQRYGGREPYVRLLEMLPTGVAPGQCLPAGHASGALWLIALAVFWLPHRPRMAAAVGGLMLLLGLAVGWMQQLRGAHFLTHTLWSIWIAVIVVDVLYRLLKPAERRAELA